MSTFYGLYTWLLLTLFDLQVIYIPSGNLFVFSSWTSKCPSFNFLFYPTVLAALFGAVPFIGNQRRFLLGSWFWVLTFFPFFSRSILGFFARRSWTLADQRFERKGFTAVHFGSSPILLCGRSYLQRNQWVRNNLIMFSNFNFLIWWMPR